mgnify:CR=1 FL=1
MTQPLWPTCGYSLLTPNETDKAQEDVWQVTLAGYAYFAL